MAVLLPDRALTLTRRSHPWRRDERGTPLPTDDDTLTVAGPAPGAAKEQQDYTWTLRLDPGWWPVREGDHISDDGGNTWVVTRARPAGVPGHPDVDYIAVSAQLEPPRVP